MVCLYELLIRYPGRFLQNVLASVFGYAWIERVDELLGNPFNYATFETFYSRVAHFLIGIFYLKRNFIAQGSGIILMGTDSIPQL